MKLLCHLMWGGVWCHVWCAWCVCVCVCVCVPIPIRKLLLYLCVYVSLPPLPPARHPHHSQQPPAVAQNSCAL